MPKRTCHRCGTELKDRRASPQMEKAIRNLTGQPEFHQYICPTCYPEKAKKW